MVVEKPAKPVRGASSTSPLRKFSSVDSPANTMHDIEHSVTFVIDEASTQGKARERSTEGIRDRESSDSTPPPPPKEKRGRSRENMKGSKGKAQRSESEGSRDDSGKVDITNSRDGKSKEKASDKISEKLPEKNLEKSEKDKEKPVIEERASRRALKKVKSITMKKNTTTSTSAATPVNSAPASPPPVDHKADTQMELRRDLDVR